MQPGQGSVFKAGPPTKSGTAKKLLNEVRKYVREFKKEYNVCADCNRDYPPYVLEFDHVDPKSKVFNVGNASSAPSMEALIDEIHKCDIVCSNCHKIREYKRERGLPITDAAPSSIG